MRYHCERRAIYNSVAPLLIILGWSYTGHGENFRETLDHQTDYQIQANTPDEQLIEVARHFQIPMAIEWLEQPATDSRTRKLDFTGGRLIDLIKAIVAQAPQEDQGRKPFWKGVPVNEFGSSPLSGRWSFLELR